MPDCPPSALAAAQLAIIGAATDFGMGDGRDQHVAGSARQFARAALEAAAPSMAPGKHARMNPVKLFPRRTARYDQNVPASGPPIMMPPGPHVTDYRTDGPEEARQIALAHRACETAPNGTGARCLCSYDCANYWLRACGYRA